MAGKRATYTCITLLDIVAQFNQENIKRSAVRKINNKII